VQEQTNEEQTSEEQTSTEEPEQSVGSKREKTDAVEEEPESKKQK